MECAQPLFCSFWELSKSPPADLDKILERADKLLEEAKAGYHLARSRGAVAAFVDAGFKLEEARIKYIVLQEIGGPDKQKIAADRLRAVNQLSKLIQNGKLAVSGGGIEGSVSKPLDPLPAPSDSKPAEPAAKPIAADVLARSAVPDATRQRDTEKLVRDLFKEQYAKKTPADRLALAQALMAQAARSGNDAAALWILHREAQDAAVQACDVPMAFQAIDAAARIFDIDATAMKHAALIASRAAIR